jgi:hypothetical protein
MVKIDVEGHALSVLRGMERILKGNPTVVFEVSQATTEDENAQEVMDFFACGSDLFRTRRLAIEVGCPRTPIIEILSDAAASDCLTAVLGRPR